MNKLTLPLTVLASLLMAALSAGGTWAATKERLEAARKAQDTQAEDIKRLDAQREEHATRIQKLEDAFMSTKDVLQDIREDVRDLKSRKR